MEERVSEMIRYTRLSFLTSNWKANVSSGEGTNIMRGGAVAVFA